MRASLDSVQTCAVKTKSACVCAAHESNDDKVVFGRQCLFCIAACACHLLGALAMARRVTTTYKTIYAHRSVRSLNCVRTLSILKHNQRTTHLHQRHFYTLLHRFFRLTILSKVRPRGLPASNLSAGAVLTVPPKPSASILAASCRCFRCANFAGVGCISRLHWNLRFATS